jgi:hypothetical protein
MYSLLGWRLKLRGGQLDYRSTIRVPGFPNSRPSGMGHRVGLRARSPIMQLVLHHVPAGALLDG